MRSFVDCSKTIKIEDVKEEINEEKSLEDPLSIHQKTENSNICEDIKEKVKEEENVDDPLFIQEGNKRSENDNIGSEVKDERILMMILSFFKIYIILEMKRKTQLLMK